MDLNLRVHRPWFTVVGDQSRRTGVTRGAHSVNLRFLAFSPVRFFNDQDWKLLEQTSDDLLANARDGESREWKNPKTGHHGSMKALRTYKNSEGETCREVQFSNFARDMSGQSRWHLCKQPDGRWLIVEPAGSR